MRSMSSDEPSPKRQRLSSPRRALSPERKTKDAVVGLFQYNHTFPETPPPSVHMSPSWTVQNLPTPAGHAHQGLNGGSGFPTPSSTSGLQMQNTLAEHGEASEGDVTSVSQTPATDDDDGEFRRDGDGDAEMQEGTKVGGETEHRMTDHERHTVALLPQAVTVVPKLYKLISEPISSSQPSQRSNLIQRYGLERIQASVARKDADGNKINKLRKSYEGKAKSLGLEGRSIKAAKTDTPVEILGGLVDPGWDQVGGDGKTWWEARWAELPLHDSNGVDALLEKTENAFNLAPGRLPKVEHDGWASLLGLDDTTTGRTIAPAIPVVPARSLAPLKAVSGPTFRSSAPASPRDVAGVLRPERAGKKRRYDESSYKGYQEGYDDDGYSTGGGSVGGHKRQKRLPLPIS